MAKGGVYILQKRSTNKRSRLSVVKIGCTRNFYKRFSSANTFIFEKKNQVGVRDVCYIFHSPKYVAHGLQVLEQIIHQYYRQYRKLGSEFFIFPREINPGCDPGLVRHLKRYNIDDLKIYTSVDNVPDI